MRRNKLYGGFYILILTVFILSGTALVTRLAALERGSQFYEQTEERKDPLPAPSTNPSPTAASRPAAPREQEPVPPEPHELSRRLSQFSEKYPDAALWLQLPDTPLDYPVMLGTDNQFYLNHLPDGSKNNLGSLFLDYRTNADSVHLIVYGHNGSGGRMFGLLKQYESEDYFLEHRTLTAATPDSVHVCPIFSVRRAEAGGGAYRLEFEEGGSLAEYIRQAAAESLYPIEMDFGDAAGVLTLSTCTGWRNQRLIVQALIMEKSAPAGIEENQGGG